MKLYTFDAAPNPQRLNMFMQLKGIEIETVQIDMLKAEQLSDEYKSVNPAGTVPALVLDNGTVLTEVIGMCVYLEELYPETPLLGITAQEKAEVISWDHKILTMIMSAVAEVLRNTGASFENRALPGPLDLPQIEELAARGRMRLEHGWPALNAEIEGKKWLVGDSITLADLDLMICAQFSRWVKCAPPKECANIHAHITRVQEALTL